MKTRRYGIALLAAALAAVVAMSIYRKSYSPLEGKATASDKRLTKSLAGSNELLGLREELLRRYQSFINDPSRHRKVLLDEILGVYLRSDVRECLETLRSMNALALVSSDRGGGIRARMDLDDFEQTMSLAAASGSSTGDDLIRQAFERKAELSPEQAFESLISVPGYLREELATRLARIWGRSSGKKAAEAFLKSSGVLQWRTQFNEAMMGWAEQDVDGAFQYLRSLESEQSVNATQLMDSFLIGLAYVKPFEAARLLSTGTDVSRGGAPLEYVFNGMALKDPEAALKYVDSQPGAYAQSRAKSTIAYSNVNRNPLLALQLAVQLPLSEESINIIRDAAKGLSKKSPDEAYGIAELQTDPYQKSAAMQGVVEAVSERDGIAGLGAIIQRGVSTGNSEWMDAAATVVLGNRALSSANRTMSPPSSAPSLDWSGLSQTNKMALTAYAKTNWSAEQVAALNAKLK